MSVQQNVILLHLPFGQHSKVGSSFAVAREAVDLGEFQVFLERTI